MADDADIATTRIESEIEAAIAARVRFSGKSEVECCLCGEEIPEARRTALPGVDTCVYCASVEEARR